VRPVAYRPGPTTIQPSELLALSGRTAPQPTFRVRLSEVLREGELKATSASGLLVTDTESHRLLAQVPGNVVYTVSLSPDGRALSGPGGKDLPSPRVRIQSISPDTPVETGERSFLGALEVSLGEDGLDVLNEVAQEDYIAGVVAGEAARSFPLEALKAQAVAARTYAMSQRGNRGSDVDVVDTVADQGYTGAGVAWPEVRQAVNATAGKVLTYGGKPIIAYFSADCGGATRTRPAGGLGGPLPYLKAVSDTDPNGRDYCAASPSHTWMLTLTDADILPKLNQALGLGMETLTDIRFTRVYRDGRAGEVRVTGLGAPVVADARDADPQAAILASLPTLSSAVPEPVPGGGETEARSETSPAAPPAPSPAPSPGAAPQPGPEPAPGPVPDALKAGPARPDPVKTATPNPDALQPDPAKSETPAVDATAPAPPETEETTEPERPEIQRFLPAFEFRKIVGLDILRSQRLAVKRSGDGTWLFNGRGYGHGVGLCQWGACGRALAGVPYDRILAHYYAGVTLEQTAPRNGTLAGIAKEKDGTPFANATVALVGTDREVKTDAAGRFRFEALPAATYDIVVTPEDAPAAMTFAWMVRVGETTNAVVKPA